MGNMPNVPFFNESKTRENYQSTKIFNCKWFVIGTFPKRIQCTDDDAKVLMRNVDAEEDIPEVLRALIVPVRPH